MKRKLIEVFILSFAILLASINVSAQKERQVFSVDEGKTDASFKSFRGKLIEAVRKRDVKYVVGILLGGKKGYVSVKFVRSPIDYRACFEKKNGKWKMNTFVAGD